MSMLEGLVPCPVKVTMSTGRLPLKSIKAVSASGDCAWCADELKGLFMDFGMDLRIDIHAASNTAGVISVQIDPALQSEGWSLTITPDLVQIKGGDDAGVFYAMTAMRQLTFLAFLTGVAAAAFDCGEISDFPRFPWRGFMLDCVRHFQPKETIIETLRLMALYRLNVFHWHLTDDEGWRLPCDAAPALAGGEWPAAGKYSPEDIREINAYAQKCFIRIVPEIDIPGHCGRLLQVCPQYACDPARPGHELCLGKPEVRAFLKRILAGAAEFFPGSQVIHLGGDEADTANWEKCPDCRRALNAAGLPDFRKLENQFMIEMSRFVVNELGRRPMVWHTGAVMPPDTIIQVWMAEHDIGTTLPLGNQVINSACNRFYFDCPYSLSDQLPFYNGEGLVTEEGVYMADPCCIWKDAGRDRIPGTEACLWTGQVPSWRVKPKLLSRLAALSETLWSMPERKQWHDFQRRRAFLAAAGYEDAICRNR